MVNTRKTPRLSERRTSIFGLTSMSFVSNFGRQIFMVFLAAQRSLRDLVSKRYFRTNCIHSIRLRTTIKAGIFPFTFSIFFRETTFLESNAGGPPTGGSHRAGLDVSKKKVVPVGFSALRRRPHSSVGMAHSLASFLRGRG